MSPSGIYRDSPASPELPLPAPAAARLRCVALVALVLMAGCADVLEPDVGVAARADSSAAGYDVGETKAPSPLVTSTLSELRSRWESLSSMLRIALRAEREGDPVPALGGVLVMRPTAPTPPAASEASGGLTPTPPRPSAQPAGTTRVATSPTDTSSLPDSVAVGELMTYYPRRRTVVVQLLAGLTGDNEALNFNGGSHGSHTLTIPAGWRVEARFVNHDTDLPHSAIVVDDVAPIPISAPPAAFPRAFTVRLQEGLLENAEDLVSFTVMAPGRYLIMCGVPGHAQGGMWIRLVGVAAPVLPSYQMPSGRPQ